MKVLQNKPLTPPTCVISRILQLKRFCLHHSYRQLCKFSQANCFHDRGAAPSERGSKLSSVALLLTGRDLAICSPKSYGMFFLGRPWAVTSSKSSKQMNIDYLYYMNKMVKKVYSTRTAWSTSRPPNFYRLNRKSRNVMRVSCVCYSMIPNLHTFRNEWRLPGS